MKKLVSIALVALLLSGAVAFADPSEIVITNYSQGDLGGVYSDQIDRAISSGGVRVGELPDLPWQKGAQFGDVVGRLLLWWGVDPMNVVHDWGTPGDGLTPPTAIEAYAKAELDALLKEGLLDIGFYKDTATNKTYWYDPNTDTLIEVTTTKDGIVYYNNAANNNAKMVWVPGATAGDPGEFKQVIAGANAPGAVTAAQTITEDLSKGVPKYLTDGFYVDGNGDTYEVSKGVAAKVARVGTQYAKTVGNTSYAWNGTGWTATTGASVTTAYLNASPTSADKPGLYSNGAATPVYKMGHKEATGTVFYDAEANWGVLSGSAGLCLSNPGKVYYDITNSRYLRGSTTVTSQYEVLVWDQSLNNGTGDWKVQSTFF